MRYLITGANGMLGRDLQASLASRDVTAASRSDLDVTDLDAVRDVSTGHDVIINCAAYTRVDDAEIHEATARAINAIGAGNLATAAAENNATLVQLSTDYVFNGRANRPYPEHTAPNPVSAYGRTKAEGERLALQNNPGRTHIVRTAWLYGRYGPNFVTTMLRIAAQQPTVAVVIDQLGQPTWTADLARQLVELLDADAPAGIYHATNSGQTSWYEFAQAIFRTAGIDPDRVTQTDSSRFPRPAPRPPYSVLGHDAWALVGVNPMRHWTEALAAAADEGLLQNE